MCSFFFFNDTATTEIYTLSLHDALPISPVRAGLAGALLGRRVPQLRAVALAHRTVRRRARPLVSARPTRSPRSEEHTSELQSPCNLVCRLLLEKKKTTLRYDTPIRATAR